MELRTSQAQKASILYLRRLSIWSSGCSQAQNVSISMENQPCGAQDVSGSESVNFISKIPIRKSCICSFEHVSLRQGAPRLRMDDFLIRILKEPDQSETGSSRAPNGRLSKLESLRQRTSLRQGAPRLRMDDFLIRILNATDQSETGSSRAPNGRLSY